MLTQADKDIIARDFALPGLVALLDAATMLHRLREIPKLQQAVQAEIQYLRYKPGNSCAGTVKVRFAGGLVQHYYAKALTKERFEESWHHPKRQALVRCNDPLAPMAIFDLGIMLLHPAYDRGIGYPGWLADDQQRRNLLSRCILPADGELTLELLRYKPERRLVAKVSQNGRAVAVIRCSGADGFGQILTGAAFGVAQGNMKLLGIDGTSRTLVTNWQEGDSLCPEDRGQIAEHVVRQLGMMLAQIHMTPYQHPVTYNIEDEVLALKGVLRSLEHILPTAVPHFQTLCERVRQGLSAQPPHSALIHGDFSLDQVVQGEDERLYILDWDRSANGHSLMDLASFQARLELQTIEGAVTCEQASKLMTALLAGYQKKQPYPTDGLYWFTASAMLRLAIEPFRKRDPQWPAHIRQLLARVEELLKQTDNQSQDLLRDPHLSTLTNIADMQALLTNALPGAGRGTLNKTVLTRYKPQRRALIDYEIDTKYGCWHVIGKYRYKGLDKRSFAIQQALWNAGFNDNAAVAVAEPLGVLPAQQTWLQRKVNGHTVGAMLSADNERLAFLGEAVAHALVALQQTTVAKTLDLPLWTVEREMQILRERLTQAQTLLLAQAERVAAVLSGCEALARQLSDQTAVTIHRDFYQDQILERQDRLGHMVLLDLDLLCQGAAALDAGNYLAHIQEFALRQYSDLSAFQVHQQAFLKHFLAGSRHAVAQDVEIYTTLSLARHIYISTQFAERRHITQRLLELCETRLRHFPAA